MPIRDDARANSTGRGANWTRRSVCAGAVASLLQPAGSAITAHAASPAGWTAVPDRSTISLGGLRYEAECGADPIAIQRGAKDVIRFTMVPGNGWSKDDPKASERTELDGWPSAISTKRPAWCAWSLHYEPGAWSTSDWCILQQMFQVGGSPIVHVLKSDGMLHWVAADTAGTGGAFPVRHKMKLEQGKWLNFIETYKFDPVGGQGYWKCWLNGLQVLDFKGALGTKGATHCFPKFGIYRGVLRPWDGIDVKTLINPVTESISVRYCNMRFGVEDLSKLITEPEPIPQWQPW